MNPFHSPISTLLFGTVGLALLGCSDDRTTIDLGVAYVAAGTEESSAIAGFYGDTFGLNRCQSQTIDRCIVSTCLDGGPYRDYIDGGKVDFEAEELEATLDTGKVPDGDGGEGPGLALVGGLPALSDGETVTMKLRGGGSVSAVEGSVTLPERLELTEPELEEPSCQAIDPEEVNAVAISATDDFVLSWTSSSEEDVDVLFSFDDIVDYAGDEDRKRYTQVRCLYTADEEGAVIGEDIVAQMPTKVRGSFTVRQIVNNAKLVGDWSITFGGYWELCSPIEVE